MLHPRVRLALMAVSTIALLAIAGFVIFSDPRSGATTPAVTGGFAGSIRPEAPPADFALRDQDGKPVRVADLRGRPVVVTFMYTTCEDDCPTMTQQIRGALDDLGRDVPVLAVSVDPANDTPERARTFLARQQMTGRMRFLLGDARRCSGSGAATASSRRRTASSTAPPSSCSTPTASPAYRSPSTSSRRRAGARPAG